MVWSAHTAPAVLHTYLHGVARCFQLINEHCETYPGELDLHSKTLDVLTWLCSAASSCLESVEESTPDVGEQFASYATDIGGCGTWTAANMPTCFWLNSRKPTEWLSTCVLVCMYGVQGVQGMLSAAVTCKEM